MSNCYEGDFKPGFQYRLVDWVRRALGVNEAVSMAERKLRFAEEAVELLQSVGYTRAQMQATLNEVYGREDPIGDPPQEVGGVATTLAALCDAYGLLLGECAEQELARIDTPEMIARIRIKQKNKGLRAPELKRADQLQKEHEARRRPYKDDDDEGSRFSREEHIKENDIRRQD